MPGKNVIKEYKPESYYHVYNRGVANKLLKVLFNFSGPSRFNPEGFPF